MKVMIFTSSYKRPHMLRQCMLNAKNQTYKDFIHAINITHDIDNVQNYHPLINDIYAPGKMGIITTNNDHTHFNNMMAIKQFADFESYDLFIKMDDDDIYKSNYVQNIVDMFTQDPTIDIVSTKIKRQLNGYKVYVGEKLFDNLGANPPGTDYHMPMTFAFNKRAFDAIKNLQHKDKFGHDDMMWRMHWEAHKYKHVAVNNENEIIWHIHGKNVSSSRLLKP